MATQVNIKKYDKKSGLQRGQFVMVSEDLLDKSLANVRTILTQAKNFNSELGRSPFCTKDGDEVAEDYKFKDYIGLMGEQSEETKIYSVCFKVKKIWAELDDESRSFVNEKLPLEFKENKTPLLEALTTQLASSYDHSQYAAKPSAKAVHPVDMTETEWNVVVRMNGLLNGQDVKIATARQGGKAKSLVAIERGVYTAFEIKERSFEPHEISSSKVASTQKLKIPRYRVTDNSSVEVFETKSSIAEALAQSSFSETAVEAAIAGGAFGVTVGAKAGYSKSEQDQFANSTKEDREVMNISYNFPRVVLHLDPDTLVLSQECKEEIEKVKDIGSLNAFYKKFGRFFARKVTLGGRLHAEKETSAFSLSTKEQKAETMKAAASVSFSSRFVSASASASHEKGSQNSKDTSDSNLDSSLTWQAQGGDTLLCNNPPAWCPTVASFYNWRIVKQDDICPLLDLISAIPGHASVRRRFADAGYIDGEVQFCLKIYKERMKEKYVGLADKPDVKRASFEVPYASSTPRERRAGYRLNYRLKYEPIAYVADHGSDEVYFTAYTKDFERLEDDLLQNGVPYRLYHPKTEKWLAATWPAANVTSKIFLYGGDIEDATIFRLAYPTAPEERYLEDGKEVQLKAYDDKDNFLGLAGRMNTFGYPDLIGAFRYDESLEEEIAYSYLHYKAKR